MADYNALRRNYNNAASLANDDGVEILGQAVDVIRDAHAANNFALVVKDWRGNADNKFACGNTLGGCRAVAHFTSQRGLYVFTLCQIVDLAQFSLGADDNLLARGIKQVQRVYLWRCLRHGGQKNFRAFLILARKQKFSQARRL